MRRLDLGSSPLALQNAWAKQIANGQKVGAPPILDLRGQIVSEAELKLLVQKHRQDMEATQ